MHKVQVKYWTGTLSKTILCVVVFATALYLLLFPILPRLPRVLPSTAKRAKERVTLLRPGMTEHEVWATLGLDGRGFKAHISGSGPPEAFPANYILWPGYVLHMRWNYKTQPATLVKAEFRNQL